MRILVTGNLGYLGPILVDHLQSLGHRVHGLDNMMQAGTFQAENRYYPKVQHLAIDSLRPDAYDVVYHLAAISNDPMGEVDDKLTMDTNVELVRTLCGMYPNARHVLASSASVYGAIPLTDVADENYEFNPLTTYAKSKVLAEEIVRSQWEFSILRMGTLWGASPNLRRDIVVNAFVYEAYHSGKIRPRADARRPMLHVSDAAKSMAHAGTSTLLSNKIVNVSAENTTVGDIANAVANVCNVQVDWTDSAGPDKRDYAMDTSRFDSVSANLPRFGRIGHTWLIQEILDQVKVLGKAYPTRIEQLREWLDRRK